MLAFLASVMLQDVQFGIRALVKRPAFTLIAATTLAIGIGANTAIFSVVHAVVLRPLPYDEPHELMVIGRDREGVLNAMSAPEIVTLRELGGPFEGVETWQQVSLNLVGDGGPQRVSGARMTAGMLHLLRVSPAQGRGFSVEEDVEGPDVVLLSDGFSKRYFGSQRAVGATLHLDGRDHTVVGVMPESFAFPDPRVELWVPMGITENEMENPGAHFTYALGRLPDDVTHVQANAETTLLMERVTDGFSDDGCIGAVTAPSSEHCTPQRSRTIAADSCSCWAPSGFSFSSPASTWRTYFSRGRPNDGASSHFVPRWAPDADGSCANF